MGLFYNEVPYKPKDNLFRYYLVFIILVFLCFIYINYSKVGDKILKTDIEQYIKRVSITINRNV